MDKTILNTTYTISDQGIVKNSKGRIIKPQVTGSNKTFILFDVNKKYVCFRLENLLCEYFGIEEKIIDTIQDLPDEIWKPVLNFEGLYLISNHGRVKSINFNNEKHSQLIKQSASKKGYLRVRINKENKRYTLNVHRMVATAFIPNPDNKPQINHSDGNKKNNHTTNIEWSTNQENQDHARKNGLILPPPKGYDNSCSMEVFQYNKYTLELIEKWGSMSEASRALKIPTTNISKSCNRKRIVAGGFIWRYADDELKSPKCPSCNSENKTLTYSNSKHSKVICSQCGYNFLLIL